MKDITIYYPSKLSFGSETINQLVDDYISNGFKRFFILSIDPVLNLLKPQVEKLEAAGITIFTDTSILAEPSFSEFRSLLTKAEEFKPDSIAGIGGGSVLDVAKLLAAMLHNSQDLSEVVGNGLIKGRKTHLVCIPTTSGTGSEVSPNSILLDDTDGGKKGIISPFLVPDAAYIDPDLTIGLPPAITAFTGIDALTHCLEAYVNVNAHPLIDTYALKGIKLIHDYLPKAMKNGKDKEARGNVAMGSMLGGMCLGPVNTAAVHALAYPLGSEYKIAHGLSNAVLLPYVMEYNIETAPERYAEIAKYLGVSDQGNDTLTALKGLDIIKKLLSDCKIPTGMSQLGIVEDDLETLTNGALQVQRLLINNPRQIDFDAAMSIYKKAL